MPLGSYLKLMFFLDFLLKKNLHCVQCNKTFRLRHLSFTQWVRHLYKKKNLNFASISYDGHFSLLPSLLTLPPPPSPQVPRLLPSFLLLHLLFHCLEACCPRPWNPLESWCKWGLLIFPPRVTNSLVGTENLHFWVFELHCYSWSWDCTPGSPDSNRWEGRASGEPGETWEKDVEIFFTAFLLSKSSEKTVWVGWEGGRSLRGK